MKKSFKRAGVAVLSMAMLLSMGAVGAMTANAATSVSVTLPSTIRGATYDIYKVAEGSESGSNFVYSAVDSPFDSVLSVAANSLQVNSSSTMVYDLDTAGQNTLARSLEACVTSSTTKAKGGVSTSTTLDSGYYLMLTKGVTGTVQPILFEVKNSAVTLSNAKASPVSLDKGILESEHVTRGTDGTTGTYTLGATNAAANIGDTVNYKIITDIPNYADGVTADMLNRDYVITDTATSGLTFLNGSTNVTVNGQSVSKSGTIAVGIDKNSDGTPDVTNLTEGSDNDYVLSISGNVMTITLSKANVVKYKGKRVVVTYSAVVNDSALISDETKNQANPNTAKLNFDNNYEGGGAGLNAGDEPKDTNNVYSASIDLTKTFSDKPTTYPKAVIGLYKEGTTSGTFDVLIGELNTSTDGASKTFNGLAAGSYQFKETTTPAGYTSSAPVTFTIAANPDASSGSYVFSYTGVTSGTNDVTITNTLRDGLPGTGGMGTVLFTVGGAAIVLLAGALFVVYLRKRKTEE